MGKENLMFRGNEVENDTFYRYKRPIFLEDADIKNVLISDKISFCEKKTINTLLLTCMMIIELNHYI